MFVRKLFLYLLLLFIPFSSPSIESVHIPSAEVTECQRLYDEMHLENVVNYSAFEQAMIGYTKINAINKDIFTLIDFSKPSTEPRLYIFDMKNRRLLQVSHVSHGKNSGENYATLFSNKNGSYKSSLGFYLTENTYQGRNGYSLILNGLEKGINDNAKQRAIVIHGAAYSNPSTIASSGRLGRSLGCPALPLAVSGSIINTIKGGSILYIYADSKNYMAQSSILSSRNTKL